MAWYNFWKKQETRSLESLQQALLSAGLLTDEITKEKALNIPTVEACVGLISDTVASLPIKLYEELDGKVKEVKEDIRVKLLNDETGDTLDSFQFKKAMVTDFLLNGNAYAYINKERNSFKSLHYVKESNVNINIGIDPIFKSYSVSVNGEIYKPYDFIKLLRGTEDGATGKGIIHSNNLILAVAYNSLNYENILAKTGGNKKGFIKSQRKLTDEAIKFLKKQWKNMYAGNSENCVVLNDGLEFQESSSTSTEMQLNENKKTNAVEICKIFKIPPSIIEGDGKANDNDYEKMVKLAILPILEAFITALNKDLLLEKEKGSFYFAFDTKELLKGDIEKRFKAYEIAIRNKIFGVNEVRYDENKPPIEALEDTIVLGLNDVLYNTKTGKIYTPNTNKETNMNLKGGENNEDRD